MFRYILRRLIFLVFLMVGVTIVVFLLSHAVPSDPVVANLSQRNLGNPEMVAAFRAKWGLDQPLYRQYFTYMSNLVQGDLGLSIRTQRPVAADLARYFPATIELAAFGILFATLFGVLFGVISAIRRNTFADHLLRGVSVFGVSVPSFWLALIMLFIFYLGFGVAPGPGRISPRVSPPETWSGLYTLDALRMGDWTLLGDALSHLVLPGICLGMFTMGLITRTTRSSLLEVLSLDFIRTARAKGLAEKNVIRKHALGNALIPVVTVIGVGFGNLLSGMVFVETIFAWPGIGQYAYQSAKNLDFPAIVGVSLLIAVNYVLINLIVDILYGLLDPRVRYDR
ncbi:MAG: ABC transporter permease [Gracilibacteraceae bacterium]|jgi:peptide/nickel transport system permease protein|nr:ABC transporter permease [Gracilibacteraceae bacterium]